MSAKSKFSKVKIIALVLIAVTLCLAVAAIGAFAAESAVTVGEMVDIKTDFAKYLAQDTVIANDEYVGKIQYTAYYDTSKGAVVLGYEGTPVVVYTINHPGIKRIGTDSNKTIIQSMLDRGYVVIIRWI